MADRSKKLLWAACLTIGLYPWFALLRLPGRYVALTTEDGVGELTQAAMFGGAALLIWHEVRACRRAGSPWMPLSVLAVGLSFVALEEISWGQRLLGYSLPTLQAVNVQSEINLHNLTTRVHGFQHSVVPIITFVYGISVPLALPGARWVAPLLSRYRIPIPPPQARPLFLLATIAFAPSPIFEHVELGELLLAAAMLVTAGASTSSGSSRRALLAIASCGGVAMLTFCLGPNVDFARGEAFRRLLIAEQFYIPFGMTRNAERLLEEEVARHDGELSMGSTVEAMSHLCLWRREALGAAAPVPGFLERSMLRGHVDLAQGHLSLALLRRLAGAEGEARQHLEHADALLDPLIDLDVEALTFAEMRAIVQLRACQGRMEEAIEMVERRLADHDPRIRSVMRSRIARLARLFDSVDIAE